MPVSTLFVHRTSGFLVVPINLKLRGIESSLTRLPTRIHSHRTEQFSAVFSRAFDDQFRIHITGIHQVSGRQQVIRLHQLVNISGATYIVSGGSRGVNIGNEARQLLITGFT